MRSRHNQDFLALQEFIMQQLRERAERNPLIEYLFKLNVPARDCVPYYHQVRGRIQIVYSKGLQHRDAERLQKIRHRWVCRRI